MRQLYNYESESIKISGTTPKSQFISMKQRIDMMEDEFDLPTFKYIQELKNQNLLFRNEIAYKGKEMNKLKKQLDILKMKFD